MVWNDKVNLYESWINWRLVLVFSWHTNVRPDVSPVKILYKSRKSKYRLQSYNFPKLKLENHKLTSMNYQLKSMNLQFQTVTILISCSLHWGFSLTTIKSKEDENSLIDQRFCLFWNVVFSWMCSITFDLWSMVLLSLFTLFHVKKSCVNNVRYITSINW